MHAYAPWISKLSVRSSPSNSAILASMTLYTSGRNMSAPVPFTDATSSSGRQKSVETAWVLSGWHIARWEFV